MNSNSQTDINQTDINQLNSFLRGELAAVETYDRAIEKIQDHNVQQPLREVRSSHDRRVDLLRQRILALGGAPAQNSGIWGSFAKVVESGATMLGTSPAIAALEEGEDHGRDDYRRDLDDLSFETQTFLEGTILPEQLRTHDTMSALKRQVRAADQRAS